MACAFAACAAPCSIAMLLISNCLLSLCDVFYYIVQTLATCVAAWSKAWRATCVICAFTTCTAACSIAVCSITALSNHLRG